MLSPHGVAAQEAVAPAEAGQIIDGVAPVGPTNTFPNPELGLLDVFLIPDPVAARKPVVHNKVERPAALLVKQWAARNQAAGLAGFVYDNRDGGHSRLRMRDFPQMAATQYSQVFQAEGLHYGAAGKLRFSLPTFGNSSTALVRGPLKRSQAREALSDQAAAMRVYALYAANNLYFYPEHRDHDPGTGDRLFANTPYLVVSQGSSGSDRPFMYAVVQAAAAMPIDTQARLISEGLLAASLQMLLRRSLAGSDAAYLSGAAHPSVFDPDRLDEVDLVQRANALRADQIPGMVQLTVKEDFDAVPGVDYLARNLSEEIFTTPSAIARAWRSYDYTRSLTISAAGTVDPNGRPLRFHWSVLRGDPSRVRITPLDDAGETARIEIDWHDLQEIRPASGETPALTSNRVDIGVFADNGATLSAPGFISITFPVHQKRQYVEDPAGQWRLDSLSLSGRAETRSHQNYADAALWPLGPWTDRLVYGPDGRLTAIERLYDAGRELEETLPVGLTGPTRTAEDGTAVPVWHLATRQRDGGFQLEQRP